MHDFLIAEGEHRAPCCGRFLVCPFSLPGPNGDGRLHSCVTCSSFCCCFFYNLVVVVIVVVVDRNVLASSFCLDPSLLGFPRDGEDSLLVYHRGSRRILDFFEKRFSFLLRGSVSQFSDQRVSISCDDVSSQWDGGAASLILIFLASTLGGFFADCLRFQSILQSEKKKFQCEGEISRPIFNSEGNKSGKGVFVAISVARKFLIGRSPINWRCIYTNWT